MPKRNVKKSAKLAGTELAVLPADCGEMAEAELPSVAEMPMESSCNETGIERAKKPQPINVRRPSNVDQYALQPVEKQRKMLRSEWSNLAYVLVERANTYAKAITKKDFGRLMQLVTTAGIAFDKTMPKVDQGMQGNLIVNLFGSLDQSKLAGVLGPTVIDSTAIEVEPTVASHDAHSPGTTPANANDMPGQDEA